MPTLHREYSLIQIFTQTNLLQGEIQDEKNDSKKIVVSFPVFHSFKTEHLLHEIRNGSTVILSTPFKMKQIVNFMPAEMWQLYNLNPVSNNFLMRKKNA